MKINKIPRDRPDLSAISAVNPRYPWLRKEVSKRMKKVEKTFKQTTIVAVTLLFPMMAMAATVTSALDQIKTILNLVIGLMFVLVTLYFIWGVVKYVMAAGEEAKVKEGKQHMIWGIIGMAVMAGAWGLVKVLLDTFGVSSSGIPTGPGTGF